MRRMASDENEISQTSSYPCHLPRRKLLPRHHGYVGTNLVSQPAFQILSIHLSVPHHTSLLLFRFGLPRFPSNNYGLNVRYVKEMSAELKLTLGLRLLSGLPVASSRVHKMLKLMPSALVKSAALNLPNHGRCYMYRFIFT